MARKCSGMLTCVHIALGLDGSGHQRDRLCLQPTRQLLLRHGLPIAE